MQNNQQRPSHFVHWADMTAERIIKQVGDKDSYTLASGITPSGVVHFGNFREVITVAFIAQALREIGKEVRFIFSWDNYDTFRKVPANLPNQKLLEQYLFRPIVDTPDPHEQAESYAAFHQQNFERQLKEVSINLEPLYQAQKYRAGEYREMMLVALNKRDQIRDILNQHRSTPLDENWYPLSVYCDNCQTDHKTQITHFDSENIHYRCENCHHRAEISFEKASNLKLPWRIDWPMRWAFEKVDFEPGGKDHSSQGGSFTTAKEIVELFNWRAPVYLQYDFVSIKGAGGKMSSSKGNLVTVDDVLKVYPPDMLRWIFASYKPNTDFSLSFDLDVIKTYEDFDRQERVAYGLEPANEKKQKLAKRVIELSLGRELSPRAPFRASFRHLTNILQIHEGELEKAKDFYRDDIQTSEDDLFFEQRAKCALNWLNLYAPDDFKFKLNSNNDHLSKLSLSEAQESYLNQLVNEIESNWESFDSDKKLHEKMYEIMHTNELKPQDIFPLLYQALISKDKGPKLAGFMRTIGKEKILNVLKRQK